MNTWMHLLAGVTTIGLLSEPAHAARSKTRAVDVPSVKSFRAELIEPGKTQREQLARLLGRPARMVRDGARQEYYFYDLGEGTAMNATVSLRDGVVEYVSYLCADRIRDIKVRYADEPSIQRYVASQSNGYSSRLTQILYEGKGRGYLYEPKTLKVRACMAWKPGQKFER